MRLVSEIGWEKGKDWDGTESKDRRYKETEACKKEMAASIQK